MIYTLNTHFKKKIEVQLIYDVVFQVHNKVIQLHMYIYLFFFRFFSIIVYYKILSIVLCSTVGPCCLPILYIVGCICYLKLRIYPPFPPPHPLS